MTPEDKAEETGKEFDFVAKNICLGLSGPEELEGLLQLVEIVLLLFFGEETASIIEVFGESSELLTLSTCPSLEVASTT